MKKRKSNLFRVSVILSLSLFALPVMARTPDDPLLGEQWYLESIHAFDAWDIETGVDDVVVAVLDAGLDSDHPDLKKQIWTNSGEIANDGKDNDHNGYVDDVHGWDFIGDDNNPIPDNIGGEDFAAQVHGTIIAGIIGAVGNNDEGVSGVAWKVKLMPVRMLDGIGAGDTTTAAQAIKYAVLNGADIINMSFSGTSYDAAFASIVKEAYDHGVLIVAAMGNQDNGGIDADTTPVYPTCFEDGQDWVLGVAAIDEDGNKADFSNYGRNCTDVSAPGTNIFGAQYADGELNTEEYGGYYDGTSVAAPQVTGAAALLLAKFPSLTVDELRLAIQLSVDPVKTRGTYYAGKLGAGSLNVARALTVAGEFVGEEEGNVESTDVGGLTFVGSPAGSAPAVYGLNSIGAMVMYWQAYAPNFLGGVNVATADVDGDGELEVITGAGVGGGPHVRIFEQDGTLIGQFFAFDSARSFGVVVAASDVDGDGDDEILAQEGAGGSNEVRTFQF